MNSVLKAVIFFGALMLVACLENKSRTPQQSEWRFVKTISLGDIAPIGIVAKNNFLWLSDVDNNRVVKIDLNGKVVDEYDGFERPMHIAVKENKIYIPEYTSDTIRILENGKRSVYPLPIQTDAIGSISINGNSMAITDFYNHRVILLHGDKATIIGKEGHKDGELYYPTDVDLKKDLIYVADAYNNRVQVFDLQANYVRMIGWNEGIKVATGVKVSDTQVIVADFEGNRVLVYDHSGKLMQTLEANFNQPADIEILDNKMFVVNYKGKSISLFNK